MSNDPTFLTLLPRLLLYPLRNHGLPAILLFTVAISLGLVAGPFGALAIVVFGGWGINYLFTCATRTALGEMTPPPIAFEQLNPFDLRFGAFIVFLLVLFTLPGWVNMTFGPAWGTATLALLIILLPAHLIIVGALGHAGHAINPLTLIRTTLDLDTIGMAAVLLCVGVAVIIPSLLGIVPFFLLVGLGVYTLILTGHAAGLAARRARHALGLATPEEIHGEADARRRELDELMDRLIELANKKPRDEANALLRKPPAITGMDDLHELQEILLWRLLRNRRTGLVREFTPTLLESLLNKRRTKDAARVLEFTRELGPQRLPKNLLLRLELARLALERSDPALAIDALDGIEGDEPGAAHAALLRARLLLEHHDDRDTARELVERVRHRTDDSHQSALTALDNLLY